MILQVLTHVRAHLTESVGAVRSEVTERDLPFRPRLRSVLNGGCERRTYAVAVPLAGCSKLLILWWAQQDSKVGVGG
jgi:hypothetical protein